MTELFLEVVNLSISAGWLVLAILLVRLILKKAPKWVNVLLWGIVAVRLICPFSIESVLSLIPSAETIPINIGMDTSPAINSGVSSINSMVNPMLEQSNIPVPGASVNPLQITIGIYANIWALGVLAMLIYMAISYFALRWKLRTAVILRGNIYQCETVSSPFVLGIVMPKIYLPYTIDRHNLRHVVAHERAHIRRKDHWWKPLGFLLLSVHWFNPLMWIAYILLCRDIELACDEKVIAELGNEQRADYTQAIVACSVNRPMIAACPLAFGEVGVKERIKSVMNYKKPAFWIVIMALICCIVVAVCFLTDPVTIGDHFVLTNVRSSADTNKLFYDIQLGNQVMSGEIYVEQWIDGTCVNSAPVVMTQYVDSIEITMGNRRVDGASVGTDIRIETNQYGGSLLTYFAHPEDLNVKGWSFNGYEPDKKIKLTADKEVILAAMAFDCGNGVRTVDIKTLTAKPEILEKAENMIVVRAVFSADPLGVTNHGEASLPTEVLTLNDVIILSQKGYDLTWSDFEKYDYTEIGSGLHIRAYEINESFELWIGGTDPYTAPMYIYLIMPDGLDIDTRIDIRNGGVAEFIQAHDEKNSSKTKLPELDQTLPDYRANGAKSFSRQELMSIYAYAEKTEQGIRMIETNNSFVSGRLIYTLTDIRVAKHADELPIGTNGFTYEACLTKDENYRWTEGIRPDFIDESGNFAKGWCVVVVDITVYNDNAAMLIGENSNHDPYVFRADSLLNIADCSKPAAHNYPYSTPDYFSMINDRNEHEFAFKLEPGEETSFSIGFMVSTEVLQGAYDLRNLKLCKTSGSVNASMIDIVSGEDDYLLGSAVSKPAASRPQNEETSKEETAQALEELGDFSPAYLPEGYEEVDMLGSPLTEDGWYSYVRKWYANEMTNTSIYFEYETYAIDTDSGYTDDARTICSFKIPGNDILNDYVVGEEIQINGMYGLATENIIVWADPKVHKVYYLFSEDVTGEELLKVAQSICDHAS